jgi:hypothetical protein
MTEGVFTALATGLLVLVGIAQAVVLVGQRRQQRLDLAELYRKRWADINKDWGTVVFLGRRYGSYYQVTQLETLRQLKIATLQDQDEVALVWAREAARNVCELLSDVCTRILQGRILVSEAYPVFGTGLLRNSAPLRTLVDHRFQAEFLSAYGSIGPNEEERRHDKIRSEVQVWLSCHDGIRRRCLILMDLLWAEAARLEDLPPHDMQIAAESKSRTGGQNRTRLFREVLRLNGPLSVLRALRLRGFLRYSEYKRAPWTRGLTKARLRSLEQEWVQRYLQE